MKVAAAPESAHTPMMVQYLGLKADFPDTLLLYRMGDFFGIANVTDQVLRFLEAKLAQLEAELRSLSGVSTLGAPVRSMRLVSLAAVEGYPDQLAAEVEIFGPVSLNAIRLTVNMSVQA
jgi:DNA mismatch repair protein MutS